MYSVLLHELRKGLPLRSRVAHAAPVPPYAPKPWLPSLGRFVLHMMSSLRLSACVSVLNSSRDGSLPPRERDRCVLLPEDGDHSISPFDDVEGRRFSDVTPRLPRMNYGKQGSTNFLGREVRRHVNCCESFIAEPAMPYAIVWNGVRKDAAWRTVLLTDPPHLVWVCHLLLFRQGLTP